MPEHDNDKVEEFFKKAAGKPDISFNEDDWKKLEARLDAEGVRLSAVRRTAYKIAGIMLTAALVISSLFWLNIGSGDKNEMIEKDLSGQAFSEGDDALDDGSRSTTQELPSHSTQGSKAEIPAAKTQVTVEDNIISPPKQPVQVKEGKAPSRLKDTNIAEQENPIAVEAKSIMDNKNDTENAPTQNINFEQQGFKELDSKKIVRELIQTSTPIADKTKRKASVVLPGAEEEDSRETGAIVKEQNVFDQKKHLATPRLSLLLSFAPDFSSTSLIQYTAPGKAYGVMIHYHIKRAWSLSAGIVKNNKRYTGDGEDYKPPKGYWKYYTNGIIPNSIDGACSILEFPVMLQYTIAESARNRFLLGAGASSYLMLNESYRYNFEEVNPGAREGWDSKKSSRFVFNMINFTIGYERQILPRLMVGVEPYIKIPIEEIGWSNLKLFSAGASLTLRYSLLKKQYSSLPIRSRGPD